jgi:ABC-type glutathione transport system ATPase component
MTVPLELISSHLNVTSHEGTQLLRDIDFKLDLSIPAAIIGASGSGKTILCRAISQFFPSGVNLNSGSVRIRTETSDLPNHNNGCKVTMVPQLPSSSLPPTLKISTLFEKVMCWNKTLHFNSVLIKPSGFLDLFGLSTSIMHLKPHQLSGGMAQRVAIIAALLTEPDIIILDEPTVGLDTESRRSLIDCLSTLIDKTKLSLIIATHDILMAKEMCTSAIVLQNGCLHAIDSFVSLQKYNDPYLRELITVPDETN